METRIAGTGSQAELFAATEAAVRELRAGHVVALPTETVYGLAADATSPEAVAGIFEAKERPKFDPLIVHLPERTWLYRVAQFDDCMMLVEELTTAFWPGPLTLVLPRWKMIPDIVTSGLPTVAVRMSAHPVFSEVCRTFGKPLAAPSANRFGRISPTRAEHVQQELGGRIPLIVDAGPTTHGVESTIVKVEVDGLTILRAGPVTREELETFVLVKEGKVGEVPDAPGQLKSHYAPQTRMVLVDEGTEVAAEAAERSGYLAFSKVPEPGQFARVEVLSSTGDLREAAATLFAKMRALDEAGVERIYAERVPTCGLGMAIMDRLEKAAANE